MKDIYIIYNTSFIHIIKDARHVFKRLTEKEVYEGYSESVILQLTEEK